MTNDPNTDTSTAAAAMTTEIVDPCVFCGASTAFGSGKFVNRIPADTVDDDGTYRDGYACEECQCIECDDCGEMTLEFESSEDGDFLCPDCGDARELTADD